MREPISTTDAPKTLDPNRLDPKRLDSGAIDRRTLLCRAGLGGASLMMGGLLAGCGGDDGGGGSSRNDPTDVDVLNFALNLEYLEASYYTIGTGRFALTQADVEGGGTAGAVAGGAPANLGALRPLFEEIAFDESSHVRAVRAAILARGGTPIARPAIDLNAVNVALRAALNSTTATAFDSDENFLLGAFLLSDVGATAYVGGAQFLDRQAVKLAAAQILAVEGYHVGAIRRQIAQIGGATATASVAISNARDALDGGGDTDQGAGPGSDPTDASFFNVAPTFPEGSANAGLAIPRTFSQVLAVVYNANAPGTAQGGLFPAGVNGNIRVVGALPA